MKIPVRLYKKADTSGEYEVPLEADVMRWFKKEGDAVKEGDELVELEAEKGNFSVEAPASGKLSDVKYPAPPVKTWRRGAAEKVGTTIYYEPPLGFIETAEESAFSSEVVREKDAGEKGARPKPKVSAEALRLLQEFGIPLERALQFYPEAARIEKEHVARYIPILEAELKAAETPLPRPGDEVMSEEVKAVPAARARARDLGLGLSAIRGSGPDGEILLADVEKHAAAKSAEQGPAKGPSAAEDGSIHLRPPRLWKTIAENLTKAQMLPAAGADMRIKLKALAEFHQTYKARFAYALWFPVMAAVVRILTREEFILFNSWWDETDSERPVVARRAVHMGLAYDRGETPRIDWSEKTISGERLKILVLRNANEKTLGELIRETQELLRFAEEKKIPLAKLKGYSFIFNNIGALGHEQGRSLLAGEASCLINLGRIDMASGEVPLGLVFDHRLIDGAMTTPFLNAVAAEVNIVIDELKVLLAHAQ